MERCYENLAFDDFFPRMVHCLYFLWAILMMVWDFHVYNISFFVACCLYTRMIMIV